MFNQSPPQAHGIILSPNPCLYQSVSHRARTPPKKAFIPREPLHQLFITAQKLMKFVHCTNLHPTTFPQSPPKLSKSCRSHSRSVALAHLGASRAAHVPLWGAASVCPTTTTAAPPCSNLGYQYHRHSPIFWRHDALATGGRWMISVLVKAPLAGWRARGTTPRHDTHAHTRAHTHTRHVCTAAERDTSVLSERSRAKHRFRLSARVCVVSSCVVSCVERERVSQAKRTNERASVCACVQRLFSATHRTKCTAPRMAALRASAYGCESTA